jgi:hypothetical protein
VECLGNTTRNDDDSPSQGRGLNPGPSDYETGMITINSRRLGKVCRGDEPVISCIEEMPLSVGRRKATRDANTTSALEETPAGHV